MGPEKKIETKFMRWVTSLGSKCLKMNPRGHKGQPDRMVVAPDGIILFIEFKVPGGDLTPLQAQFHKEMEALGHEVKVCRSVQEAQDYYKEKTGYIDP